MLSPSKTKACVCLHDSILQFDDCQLHALYSFLDKSEVLFGVFVWWSNFLRFGCQCLNCWHFFVFVTWGTPSNFLSLSIHNKHLTWLIQLLYWAWGKEGTLPNSPFPWVIHVANSGILKCLCLFVCGCVQIFLLCSVLQTERRRQKDTVSVEIIGIIHLYDVIIQYSTMCVIFEPAKFLSFWGNVPCFELGCQTHLWQNSALNEFGCQKYWSQCILYEFLHYNCQKWIKLPKKRLAAKLTFGRENSKLKNLAWKLAGHVSREVFYSRHSKRTDFNWWLWQHDVTSMNFFLKY